MTSETSGDLNGLVEQLEAQRQSVAVDLSDLLVRKADLALKIRAKRLEQAKVERLWRATQPRKARTQ